MGEGSSGLGMLPAHSCATLENFPCQKKKKKKVGKIILVLPTSHRSAPWARTLANTLPSTPNSKQMARVPSDPAHWI